MLAPNIILQNRYRVVRKLGEGGMGAVYEAIDQRVSCVVALKETLTSRDSETRRAFEREASLLANLRHSALPKVMDYFSENGGDFLVMEFIPGYDLAELLDLRGSPFPQSQVLRWADDLLRVLEYLHSQEPPILHRDIKPSNLKLTKQGEVFLLDFGLAKGSLGQMATLAASRSVRGYTPVYASLEQIHGHGTDPRSDLYSLGATLYHLLAGAAPRDAPKRYQAAEDEEPDPLLVLDKVNPLVTPRVAAVIHQAMSLSRKNRPASAAEMRQALRNAAEEDARLSSEEEYRNAEARRRERDEGKRRSEAETARQAEEQRQQQEAEARKLEEARQEAERRRLEQEQAARRAEAEAKKRAEEERLKRAAETQRAIVDEETRNRAEQEAASREAAERAHQNQKTIPAPPPKPFVFDPQPNYETGTEEVPTRFWRKKRALLIAAVIVMVSFGGFLLILLKPSVTQTGSSTNSTPTPTGSSSSETPSPMPMVDVPGATFMMGRNKQDGGDAYESPAHSVTIEPFSIDVYEVTNEQYANFVKATNHQPPPDWVNGKYPSGAARKPVTGVTWDDADAYAKWLGKRLPTEEEWEFAALGTDSRRYPWGNEWQPDRANADGAYNGLVEVGSYKNGASPFGVYDMVGNAWEWTASGLKAYPGGQLPKQRSGDLRVIRGGSYESTKEFATTTYRTGWPARGAKRYDQTGFRCVKDVSK